jgi:hypothetical protein
MNDARPQRMGSSVPMTHDRIKTIESCTKSNSREDLVYTPITMGAEAKIHSKSVQDTDPWEWVKEKGG